MLTGLDGYFSAGVDLKVVPTYDAERQREMVAAINALVTAAYGCAKPVVGAVSGHAIAGGLVLALCCDYRICARGDFRFGLTEALAGVPFPAAAMAVTRRELSSAAARRLVLVNQTIGPEEALAYGVIDEIVDSAELAARARERASEMAAISPESFTRTKRALRAEALKEMEEIVRSGADPALQGWLTAETARSAAALLSKKAK